MRLSAQNKLVKEPAATADFRAMRLLVFAHTPPPHHGQSFMVQVMLEGLNAAKIEAEKKSVAPAIEFFHVNSRYSRDMADVGDFRWTKLWLVFRYGAQALWCRFRHGVDVLYYVPAPARETPLFRDYVAMLICRPFFRRIIFHWHAVGLGEWATQQASPLTRWLTRRLLGHADLSIVLSKFNEPDAARLNPGRIRVVSNGIPDPCPDFRPAILEQRQRRLVRRQKLLAGATANEPGSPTAGVDHQFIEVLFLAHCTREKGLFDAMDAVLLANEQLRAANSPVRFRLTVAGNFVKEADRAEFETRLRSGAWTALIEQVGFVAGDAKRKQLEDAEIFLFPTFYANEGQPVNLIEAMACGLPIVTTRWRSIPEFIPDDYPGLVEPHDPAALAAALLKVAKTEDGERFRAIYEKEFRLEQHLQKLTAALLSVEE